MRSIGFKYSRSIEESFRNQATLFDIIIEYEHPVSYQASMYNFNPLCGIIKYQRKSKKNIEIVYQIFNKMI